LGWPGLGPGLHTDIDVSARLGIATQITQPQNLAASSWPLRYSKGWGARFFQQEKLKWST